METIGNLQGLTSDIHGIIGPWKCEKCGHMTQYADVGETINIIFCRFHRCDFRRTVDKRLHIIIEDDGSMWEFDPTDGTKVRITPR